jgi:hypothetical protein
MPNGVYEIGSRSLSVSADRLSFSWSPPPGVVSLSLGRPYRRYAFFEAGWDAGPTRSERAVKGGRRAELP